MAPPPPPVTHTWVASTAPSWMERLAGASTIAAFLTTWISSLSSPFLLAAAMYYRYMFVTAMILSITVVSYLPWKPGMLSRAMNQYIFRFHPNYYNSFHLQVVNGPMPNDETKEKKKQQPVLYTYHPHGAFCMGWAALYTDPRLKHVRFCFAPGLYLSPFFRLWARMTGHPGSAGKNAMKSYMKGGEHLALPPGGFEEATITSLHQDRAYIKKRYGFIRLALQYGYAVRPIYAFGERSLYWNLQGGWKFRLEFLNRYNIPAIVTWGEPLLPLMPRHDVDMRVVVGPPLELPKIEAPTRDQVALWHGKYMVALSKLFDEHKEHVFGSEKAKVSKLELW